MDHIESHDHVHVSTLQAIAVLKLCNSEFEICNTLKPLLSDGDVGGGRIRYNDLSELRRESCGVNTTSSSRLMDATELSSMLFMIGEDLLEEAVWGPWAEFGVLLPKGCISVLNHSGHFQHLSMMA